MNMYLQSLTVILNFLDVLLRYRSIDELYVQGLSVAHCTYNNNYYYYVHVIIKQ